MKKVNEVSREMFVKGKSALGRAKERFLKEEKGEVGLSYIFMIAATCILAAFIIIPGLRTLATSVMTGVQNWWSNTISNEFFQTS